ncbi:MAG TPA: TPM domain-containing protein, partial [Syntrophorhabdaceae bacterium]|nr:TPM domain-containing protein [Syntrophorhabdaceae bacterium]
LWWYIPLTFIFFPPFWLVMRRTPYLKALFSGTGRRERAVRDRAVRAFYEKGLYRTKGNTGILFFISLLERKVWVLADKGIHEKITQAKLNAFARTVSAGIRQGTAADALVEAIGEAGRLLEEHFPTVEGDTNELTDEVITSDRETV